MRPQGVLETVLYCPDLDAAREFYTGVLGLELASAQTERHVFLRCGDGMLLLFNPDHTSRIPVPIGDAVVPLHGGRGPGHMAFRATREERSAAGAITCKSMESAWRPRSNGPAVGAPSTSAIPPATAWNSPRRSSGGCRLSRSQSPRSPKES